jgi:hypothetical protein
MLINFIDLGILIFFPLQWVRCILRLAFWKCIPLTWETPWGQHRGATGCEGIICHKSYFITAFIVWHINSTATQEFRCIIRNHCVQYRITTAYKWSQSWARWIHSTLLHHVSLRSIKLLALTHRYSKKNLYFQPVPTHFSSLPYASHGHSSYYSRFYCPNDIWGCVQIMKLLTTRFSLDSVKSSWV